MEWKQAYDSGELENSVLITERIRDLSALPAIQFFYSRREAADAAAAIHWSKNSARSIGLPLGRQRWAISDEHNNVLTVSGYNRLLAEAR
jgi:hypothetical protein